MSYQTCIRSLAAAAITFAATAGAQNLTTPGIAGVVNAGTPIQIVKEGFDGTAGPLPQADGSLLFTENRAGRVVRVAADGSTSVWLAASGGANALALTLAGEIVATLTEKPSIGMVQVGQAPRVLVDAYEGKPFNRPNDLVTGRLGQIYFTDPGANPAAGQAPPPTAVYHLAVNGQLRRIATDTDIQRPNGIALSPDERTLYVADTAGEWLLSYELDAQGVARERRNFAKLAGFQQTEAGPRSGADGLAVDAEGRLYVASTVGVQVFSPRGEALGIIALPNAPQNLAFAGADRASLYVVGRGSVYRVETLTRGPPRPGK
jgi:gluconolactonase